MVSVEPRLEPDFTPTPVGSLELVLSVELYLAIIGYSNCKSYGMFCETYCLRSHFCHVDMGMGTILYIPTYQFCRRCSPKMMQILLTKVQWNSQVNEFKNKACKSRALVSFTASYIV